MEQVCPVCNGIEQIKLGCPRCGYMLRDGGNLQDFYGPYSPYIERNAYGDLAAYDARGRCVHLLFCPQCGYDRRIVIHQVEI